MVGYQQGQSPQTAGGTYGLNVIPKGLGYISDLPFVSATNGLGPVERDENVGGSAAMASATTRRLGGRGADVPGLT